MSRLGALRSKWFRQIVRIGGTILLFVVLFSLVPAGQILNSIRKVRPLTLAAIVAVFLLIQLVSAFKWHVMVNLDQRVLAPAQSVQFYFAGLLANTVLPTVIAIDAVAMTAGMKHSSSKVPVVVGTLINRFLDFSAMVLLTVAGVILMPSHLDRQAEMAYEVVLAVFAVAVASLVIFLAGLRFFRLSFRWRRRLIPARRSIGAFFRRPAAVLAVFAISMLLQLGFIGVAIWVGALLGVHLAPAPWLFLWPLTKLIALVPIAIGGLGARELALTSLLAPFGVPRALGASVGFVFSCVVMITNLLAGLVSLLLGKFHKPAGQGPG